nr:hypothetical protein [Tanacetum cinerariifolium]
MVNLSVTVAHGQSLGVLPSLLAVSKSGSHVTTAVSGSVYPAIINVSGASEAGTPVHTLAHGGSEAHGVLSVLTLPNLRISSLRSTSGGYKGGGSGGDGMARSLSTSASSGRDMEVNGRIVILAPVVALSMEGGGMMGSIPSGGEASSSI